MTGDYTRYGEVAPLLAQADDRFVIMGHGEELTLTFPLAAFPATPPDTHRTFLLKTDSYCKDMDLYTATPETLEPLPFHGMSRYPYDANESYPQSPKHQAYQKEYNTRNVFDQIRRP